MSVPNSPASVLALVHQLAAQKRILLLWPEGRRADHVDVRMRQRGATARDVQHALENASTCEPGDPEEGERPRWKVTGLDLDADPLTVLIELDGTSFVVVITLY
ncbi:MAG: DUF4258 domain-containing protein [Sandaracinaceae bacterium]